MSFIFFKNNHFKYPLNYVFVAMRKKVGLALGSGGPRGGAHIGVIKVLLENNIPIDYIAGSSAGAVVGAYFALHQSVDELERLMRNFGKRDMLEILDLNNPGHSLIKGDKVRNFMNDRFYQGKSFRDTRIPLRITASVLENGSLFVFKSGKIADAVRASGSVPGIFPPVNRRGKHLVDGGLVDPVPIDVVKQMGAEVVIAVDLSMFAKVKMTNTSSASVLERSFSILRRKVSDINEILYGNEVLVLRPHVQGTDSLTNPMALYDSKNYIKHGEDIARKALPKIRRLIG